MRIHHLNCGTLRPFGRRAVNGEGLPFLPGRMVCHCLLLETDRGLVLVDTGFGLADVERGRKSLLGSVLSHGKASGSGASPKLERARDRYTRFMTRARFDPEETAIRQLEALGYRPGDVTDIVLTHLDLDHAGGLRDFPSARVHLTEAEHRAAMAPASPQERFRYWAHQWSHEPEWVTYASGGDAWFGFESARELSGLRGLALVPLPGHTRGHAGVAVRLDGSGAPWLLHAGDAYFFRGEVDPESPHAPKGLAAFQVRLEVDREARRSNQKRLRQLRAEHGEEVEMFCSHDPVEFGRRTGRE